MQNCKSCDNPIDDGYKATISGTTGNSLEDAVKQGDWHLKCLEEEIQKDWVDAYDWQLSPYNPKRRS